MFTILIFGLQYPEPDSTAAGTRMLQIISLLQSLKFDVHFACASDKTSYSYDLEINYVKTYSIKLNDKSVFKLLQNLNPEVVIFDRFVTEEQFGWQVDEQCPDALKILDTEDLHFLRESREQALRIPQQNRNETLLNDKAKRELAAIYRCDWSLMISKAEIDLLSNTYKISQQMLFYLPFVYCIKNQKSIKLSGYEERQDFMSIGNFKHKPNMDMVQFLYHHIWPKIRKRLPRAEWHIYGAYCPQSIKQWHSVQKGVIVKARATEVLSTMKKYKVMLAPLRFGAGLKGKCIDSMRSGTPSVTSDIGTEGITDTQNWPGFVENEPEGFANKAVELYANTKIWESKHQLTYKVLSKHFDINKFDKAFYEKINESLKHLDTYRAQNRIGQILKHHHHRSTKFMSLWIEEKNKVKP